MSPAVAACLTLVVARLQTPAHRVVIEVNVRSASAYGVIVNNAENLVKAFAPEKVAIEIVCHGDGIGLLARKSNSYAARLEKLVAGGATLAACGNTLRGRNIDRSTLLTTVVVVKSGVWEVVRKQEDGWSYLKGGT